MRKDEDVPALEPRLDTGMPHYVEGGSIMNNMTPRLSHTHALYKNDNEKLYAIIDEPPSSLLNTPMMDKERTW